MKKGPLLVSAGRTGGANQAMLRHREALASVGIDSPLLLGEELRPGFSGRFVHAMLKLVEQAPIAEIRLTHSGSRPSYFEFEAIPALSSALPVVMRLSDMNPFTGFCPYSYGCERWKRNCFPCPMISGKHAHLREIRAPNSRRAVAREFSKKRKAFENASVHVVAPSAWMAGHIKESVMAPALQSLTIIPPFALPRRFIEPSMKTSYRERLGIRQESKVICVIAPSPRNYRKGFDFIPLLMAKMRPIANLTWVIVGNDVLGPSFEGHRIVSIPRQTDERSLAELLSVADFHLMPSRADNSSQILVESLAAATPSICFDVGGNAEIIVHGQTGFVIEPYNLMALKSVLEHQLDLTNTVAFQSMRRACYERAEYKYGQSAHLDKFLKLYERVNPEGNWANVPVANTPLTDSGLSCYPELSGGLVRMRKFFEG